MPAPQAYIPKAVLNGSILGIGDLSAPEDICASDEYGIFLADSGNSRLICFDSDWSVVRIIDEFVADGRSSRLKNPTGVCVDAYGNIYVADQGNNRVVVFDSQGAYLRQIGAPEVDYDGVIPEDFRYIPTKVGVDRAGRVYVIGREVFDGLMQFSADGSFSGFVGAPRVARSVVDVFWQKIATREQRERLSLFLPTEYSNLDVDAEGFVYATASGTAIKPEHAVRRLNPAGDDVLRRTGFTPPIGDPKSALESEPASRLVDIVARDHGMYTVLDQVRGRLFTYDANGNLLYVFGGLGDQAGTFVTPVAVAKVGDRLAVLDKHLGRITVFSPTPYASSIHFALMCYAAGRYDLATSMWQRVLALNANYDLAYSGIGDALMRQGRFAEAMVNFRLGQNREHYSKALAFLRRETVYEYFSRFAWILLAAILCAVAARPVLSRIARSRASSEAAAAAQTIQSISQADRSENSGSLRSWLAVLLTEVGASLRYSAHVITHPYDGFTAVKYERRGSVLGASVIFLLLVFTYIAIRQYTGFVFNHRNLAELNVLTEFLSVAIPVGLWCVVNWSLTTLMEGKGTPRDVFVASGYAVVPAILVNLPLTVVSNVMTLQEGTFYYLMIGMSLIWTVALFFVGTMVIHDYSFAKTAATLLMTVVGIGFVLYLGLLFVTLMNEVVRFVTSVYFELSYRL